MSEEINAIAPVTILDQFAAKEEVKIVIKGGKLVKIRG
jgi:hypothetical protein